MIHNDIVIAISEKFIVLSVTLKTELTLDSCAYAIKMFISQTL